MAGAGENANGAPIRSGRLSERSSLLRRRLGPQSDNIIQWHVVVPESVNVFPGWWINSQS